MKTTTVKLNQLEIETLLEILLVEGHRPDKETVERICKRLLRALDRVDG